MKVGVGVGVGVGVVKSVETLAMAIVGDFRQNNFWVWFWGWTLAGGVDERLVWCGELRAPKQLSPQGKLSE